MKSTYPWLACAMAIGFVAFAGCSGDSEAGDGSAAGANNAGAGGSSAGKSSSQGGSANSGAGESNSAGESSVVAGEGGASSQGGQGNVAGAPGNATCGDKTCAADQYCYQMVGGPAGSEPTYDCMPLGDCQDCECLNLVGCQCSGTGSAIKVFCAAP